jgi:hypothetical protein
VIAVEAGDLTLDRGARRHRHHRERDAELRGAVPVHLDGELGAAGLVLHVDVLRAGHATQGVAEVLGHRRDLIEVLARTLIWMG